MTEWIHCNKCTIRFNPNTTFFLTECGHICCQRCVERIKSSRKCSICSKSTSVIELNKNIEPSVSTYFLPLEEVHKKTLEVYNFQLKHRNFLFQSLLNKYAYAKKECIKCNDVNKKLMKEIKMLRSLLQTAGQNSQPFVTSTPTVSENMTSDYRSDMSSTMHSKFSLNMREPDRLYPGFPRRMCDRQMHHSQHLFTPSEGPSPVQMVPTPLHRKSNEPVVPIHRSQIGMTFSLDDLRRRGNSK